MRLNIAKQIILKIFQFVMQAWNLVRNIFRYYFIKKARYSHLQSGNGRHFSKMAAMQYSWIEKKLKVQLKIAHLTHKNDENNSKWRKKVLITEGGPRGGAVALNPPPPPPNISAI